MLHLERFMPEIKVSGLRSSLNLIILAFASLVVAFLAQGNIGTTQLPDTLGFAGLAKSLSSKQFPIMGGGQDFKTVAYFVNWVLLPSDFPTPCAMFNHYTGISVLAMI